MKRSLMLSVPLTILGNAAAVVCMHYFGWTVLLVVLLYWVESVIIGLATLGKMLKALLGYEPIPGRSVRYSRGGKGANLSWSSTQSRPRATILGFAALYGGLLVFFGLLLFTFLGVSAQRSGGNVLAQISSQLGGLGIVVVAMLVEHAVAAWFDFLAGPEWAKHDPQFHAWRVSGRVIVLYLMVFLAAFLVVGLGWNRLVIIVFVAFKTFAETIGLIIESHGEWRRSFGSAE